MVKIYTEEELEECPICLEVFWKLNKTHKLKCGHRFHRKCISIWIVGDKKIYKKRYKKRNMNICGEGNCPICRQQIQEIIFSEKFVKF